jgi:hypothetical protein
VLTRDVGEGGSGAVQRLCSDMGFCSDRRRGTMCLMRGRSVGQDSGEWRVQNREGIESGRHRQRQDGQDGRGGMTEDATEQVQGARDKARQGKTRQDKARPDKTRPPTIE